MAHQHLIYVTGTHHGSHVSAHSYSSAYRRFREHYDGEAVEIMQCYSGVGLPRTVIVRGGIRVSKLR